MIDRTRKLPLTRQCQILDLARSTAYYQAVPVSPEDLALMRRIDELHLNYPFAGAKMPSRMLKREGQPVSLRRVSTLMKRMDINALYRKPNTSKLHPAHPVCPYLLRNLSTDFCKEAVHEAINRYGKPAIFNTDQGCQFIRVRSFRQSG